MLNEERIIAIKEIKYHVDSLFKLSETLGLGDPFSYNRMREILMAICLEHDVSKDYAGGDAVDKDGEEVEYKSTIQPNLNGTYHGISNYNNWDEQWSYICNKKIGCYKWHYIARFEGYKIVEIWKISGEKVLRLLEPALKRSWLTRHKRKDPRLGAVLTKTQIQDLGEKIIGQ